MQRPAATAIVLCILTQGAIAECIAPSTTKTSVPTGTGETVRTTGAAVVKSQPDTRAGGELIKTAAASTREDAPAAAVRGSTPSHDGQDHPRRGGTAMLLAALALMSGIALRRYGAHDA